MRKTSQSSFPRLAIMGSNGSKKRHDWLAGDGLSGRLKVMQKPGRRRWVALLGVLLKRVRGCFSPRPVHSQGADVLLFKKPNGVVRWQADQEEGRRG